MIRESPSQAGPEVALPHSDAHMDSERESMVAPASVLVPGGRTRMGSTRFYPEERPVVWAEVADVRWQAHPVTNAAFAAFVEETGHVSVAERAVSAVDFPDADPEQLVAGSLVFTQQSQPVDLGDWTQWWRWQPGASWRAPAGPGSDWRDIPDHPAVHLGWEDAAAYAAWAGLDLPTEAEFEHAARGGLQDADYAWGETLHPDGAVLANTWLGAFPWRSEDPHGHHRTSPVASYPANGYGLYDMIGNVWEWTADAYAGNLAAASQPCCGGASTRQASVEGQSPSAEPEIPRQVLKGGSHLCAPNYCQRYRPAARWPQPVDTSTSHVGFRCIVRR